MAQLENEKTLSGDMEIEIVERFDAAVDRLNFVKKKVMRSLALWWLALSDDEKKALYHEEAGYTLNRILEGAIKTFLEGPEGAKSLAAIVRETGRARLRTQGRQP